MKWSKKTHRHYCSLIEKMRLPEDFYDIIQNVYMPLAAHIVSKLQGETLLVSISGAQGTGKSTLTSFLKDILESELQCGVAELSIDDFYLTRNERQKLAHSVHPLLVTRGVPGTHDVSLLEQSLLALINGEPCRVPKFDKAADDRCAQSQWTDYASPVKIILFEGWFNNCPVQSREQLLEPINELERKEDAHGVWRTYVNDQLKQYHQRIFDFTDVCIMLKAPDFESIYKWRRLQEHKLKESLPIYEQQHVMSDNELKRFIQHYERISLHSSEFLPDVADLVLPVSDNHALSTVIEKKIPC